MKSGKVLALAAVLTIFTASYVLAQDGPDAGKEQGDKGGQFKKLADELKLTPEQKAALEKQREAFIAKMKTIRDNMRAVNDKIRAELEQAAPDRAKITAMIEDVKKFAGEKTQAIVDKTIEMKKILTAEQFARMKESMEKKRQEFKARRGEKAGK